MVVDIVMQTEINKKETKLYPFRKRSYHPNFSVKPLTGKFYARHDFTDPNLIDADLEQTILRKKMALSKDKFKEPLTGNMEYGWYVRPRVMRARFNYYFPKRSSYITQVGALIAAEDEKIPKKPFTGIAFKV